MASAAVRAAFDDPREYGGAMGAIRDYVTACDGDRFPNQGEGLVRVDVTHSNLSTMRMHDIQLHKDMSIGAVKERLYRHGGTGIDGQELFLRRSTGDTIFMGDDDKTLGSYGVANGMEIYIKDVDPYSLSKNGGLEDLSQVEKYVMSDEAYDRLENTVRAKKRAEAAARAGAREAEPREVPERPPTPEGAKELFFLGARCQVAPGGRRGTIAHVGPISAQRGTWIGIVLDEPQGMNDGTKDGKRYFDCQGPGYGCFARPEHVEVGDFPELDPFASDGEDEF